MDRNRQLPPKISITDVNEYLDTLTAANLKKSPNLKLLIDYVYNRIPKSKYKNTAANNTEAKLHTIQAFVKSLLPRKNSNITRRVQNGGDSRDAYIGMFITFFIGYIILLRMAKAAQQSLSARDKEYIENAIYKASYSPIAREQLLNGYPVLPPRQKAYIDEICMRDYGARLQDMPYQEMPSHPIYIEPALEGDEYDNAVASWELDYISRVNAGLPVPEEEDELLPEGYKKYITNPKFTTTNAENIGERNVPAGSENVFSLEPIETGDEMIELHKQPGHYYRRNGMETHLTSPGPWPKTNPFTREEIKKTNMKRYTARVVPKPSRGGKSKRTRKSHKGRKN